MIQKWIRRWDEFWFAPVPLLNLAIFRIVFCFTLFAMYFSRHQDVKLFYTDIGFLPKSLAFQALPETFRPPWMLAFWPDSWVPWMHGLLVLILFLMALGAVNRSVTWIAVWLQLAFLFRNHSVSFGADQIGTIFLLYLALTNSSARLSVLSWWRERKGIAQDYGDLLTSVFYRMIQVQLCIVYVYSGMEKLKGMSWWDGTAVWSVLANSQMVIADFTWLRHLALAVVFISFSTILFELYFPVLVWFKALRKPFLLAGVFFHSGIGIVMALWSFAIVMISAYVLFLPEDVVQKRIDQIRLKLRRLQ